ncbi:unnamed protein product [Microthlaspi erraticum]|uniref:DUF659 domain-containing protein n=1 Tax=Microthlaspi erraticum TaxID=1685480 RepID=A0A6D2JH11_9BRAS|nr:unnamed protein product [Microthlaspi erraticum]
MLLRSHHQLRRKKGKGKQRKAIESDSSESEEDVVETPSTAKKNNNKGKGKKRKEKEGGYKKDGSLRICKVSDKVVREATNEMLVLAELPLAFVEGLGWKHFSGRGYEEYSWEYTHRLSLTTDIWVAPHTRASYMKITAHFIDAWWQLRKLIIGFKNVYDHRGATICRVLMDCMAEWDIKRVFCITVDNAIANSITMKLFKEEIVQIAK